MNGVQVVAGSNPVAPTTDLSRKPPCCWTKQRRFFPATGLRRFTQGPGYFRILLTCHSPLQDREMTPKAKDPKTIGTKSGAAGNIEPKANNKTASRNIASPNRRKTLTVSTAFITSYLPVISPVCPDGRSVHSLLSVHRILIRRVQALKLVVIAAPQPELSYLAGGRTVRNHDRDGVFDPFKELRREHQEIYDLYYGEGAETRQQDIKRNRYYYDGLRRVLQSLVEEHKSVLSVRCDVGQYLEWVRPSRGVGIESSQRLVDIASTLYPDYTFLKSPYEGFTLQEKFDYVLIVDGCNDMFDVQEVLDRVRLVSPDHTRVILINYNFLWEPLARLAESFGLKRKQPKQNWLSPASLINMAQLSGFETIRTLSLHLIPIYVPFLSRVCNDFVAPLPLMDRLCLTQVRVLRLPPRVRQAQSHRVCQLSSHARMKRAMSRRPW